MSLHVFCLRNGSSIKYVRIWWRMRSSSKMPTTVYTGTWCHTSFICKHLLYILSCFWRNFCLIVSCFSCRNLTLPLFKKDALHKICENMGFHWQNLQFESMKTCILACFMQWCVCQKRLFFSNEISFCCHEISFFYVKLFLRVKDSQDAFNFNQTEF